jgi:hypothetical protein
MTGVFDSHWSARNFASAGLADSMELPAPASAIISLFPHLRLYLDESACIGDEDVEFEGSDHMEMPPHPPLASPPPTTTETEPEPQYIIEEEEILMSGSNSVDEEMLAQVILIEDDEQPPPPPPRELLLAMPITDARHQTRSTEATPENAALRTLVPSDPDHHINLIGPMDEGWMNDRIYDLSPPIAPPGMTVHDAKSQAHLYNNTEIIGRFLIKRGFPLIGKGSTTLVFLLTDTTVAKVAKYREDVNPSRFRQHRKQRKQDVLLHRDYPSCFAETRFKRVDIAPPHQTFRTNIDDKVIIIKGRWSYFGWYQDLYVQELVQPLVSISSESIYAHPNYYLLSQMINRNRHLLLHQWGMTRVKRMDTFVRDPHTGAISRVTWQLSWLVPFDYQ